RSQVELAERIAELSGIPDAKVFFTNSGTEANETALMLATQYRRSDQVLAIRNSYHGRAFATIGVTGNRGWSATSLSPVRVSYVHGGYRYRSPFKNYSDSDYIKACVDDLRDVLQTATSGDVACMIAEPIQGVGGFTVPPDGLYAAFKEVLDEYGILFISDEVQTGWGRTGEHYWGIQVATAGALAVLDYVESHELQRNAAVQGTRLIAGLRAIADDHPIIGDVRGKGLMVGLEFVEPGGQDPSPALATAVLEETRAR